MLLDDWSDEELGLARAIGAGRVADPPGTAGADLGTDDPLDDPFLMDPGQTPAGPERAETDGSTAIALDLKSCGGDGVMLSLMVDGQRARVWADESAWCDWLSPRLDVQRLQQIPPDLLGLLVHWALLPLQPHAEQAGLGMPRFAGIETGSCARAIAPTLCMRRHDAQLDLRLLDWPEPWISALAQTMRDCRPRLSVPPIPVALAAGWTRMTRAQLAGLQPGDGVVIDRAVRVEQGHAWLIAERPLARLSFDGYSWAVEESFQEEYEMDQIGDASLTRGGLTDDSIVLTAVAEVGRLSMSLDTLRELQAGQVLELAHASHGRVTLTVSGQPVASGTLLRVGDKLVMRVE